MTKNLRPLLSLLGMMLLACSAPPAPAADEAGEEPAASLPRIDFELADLDGETFRPADFEGEYLLIEFWATWCGPCHLQARILEELYPAFRSRGMEFVAVSVGERPAVVRDFVAERPFAYRVLLDPDDYFAINHGVFVLPTIVILDREGTVRYSHEGISTADRLEKLVAELLPAARSVAGL